MKKEYYQSKKYEVFESKEMILIFRRTFFGLYKWIKSFNKEYYNYEEDDKMIIVGTNASNSNSSSDKSESFNKGYEVNQKWFTQMATPLLIT